LIFSHNNISQSQNNDNSQDERLDSSDETDDYSFNSFPIPAPLIIKSMAKYTRKMVKHEVLYININSHSIVSFYDGV